ncbi:MAG: hypothetical protein U0234_09760 [Sandaracinus sp.]
MRRRLPIRVESPCQEDWSAMSLRGEGRHCARCDTTVLDLTRVTQRVAEQLIRERGGEVCARVRADAQGLPTFAPEPRRKGLAPLVLASALAACGADPDQSASPSVAAVESETVPVDGGDDAAPLVVVTSGTTGSFGGSLATGVSMPVASPDPAPTPPIATHETGEVAPPGGEGEPCTLPTPEQRELTRRKQQERHGRMHPPPPPHLMGAVMLAD